MTSGSLLTPLVSAARIKPEYDVPSPRGVDRAVEVPDVELEVLGTTRTWAGAALAQLLDHQGFGPCSRAIGVAVGNLHWRGRSGAVELPGVHAPQQP